MTPAEARAKLIVQHEQLRDLLDAAAQIARRYVAGEAVGERLDHLLAVIRALFDEHNHVETELLEPMLRDRDAYAPLRIARMIEEHAEEHAAFVAFLARGAPQIAPELAGFVEEVTAHMDAEERIFLNVQVLP
jgi:iron-sulfur cluster repair protein YtfE (RIC family)